MEKRSRIEQGEGKDVGKSHLPYLVSRNYHDGKGSTTGRVVSYLFLFVFTKSRLDIYPYNDLDLSNHPSNHPSKFKFEVRELGVSIGKRITFDNRVPDPSFRWDYLKMVKSQI